MATARKPLLRPSYGSTEYTNTILAVIIVLGVAAHGGVSWTEGLAWIFGALGLHNVGRHVVKAREASAGAGPSTVVGTSVVVTPEGATTPGE